VVPVSLFGFPMQRLAAQMRFVRAARVVLHLGFIAGFRLTYRHNRIVLDRRPHAADWRVNRTGVMVGLDDRQNFGFYRRNVHAVAPFQITNDAMVGDVQGLHLQFQR